MLYFIRGTSDKIYTAFGLSALLRSGTTSKDIDIDLFRTLFFGSKENCQTHINAWLDCTKSDYKHYSQGNMSAGNLFLIFGPEPFFKENEQPTDYYNNNVNLHFAFIDQNKVLSGLNIYYRRDDPTKWMIGLIKHTNLASNQRQVYILTSVHPHPFIKNKKAKTGNLISVTEPVIFTALLEHPFLSRLLNLNIMPDGQINPNFEIIGQFLQNVALSDNYQDNQSLLTTLKESPEKVFSNKALQVAQQLEVRLSISQIFNCLDKTSLLYKNICHLPQFKVTKARRWCDLLLLLDQIELIEKWDLLTQNKLLAKHLFAKIDSLQASFLKNALSDESISSLLFLINHNEFAAFYEKINEAGRNSEIIWRNLNWLTHLKEGLPKETFKQTLLCKLIFYIGDISSLWDLINVLQDPNLNLEKIFSPTEFAQFLTEGFYTSHLSWQDIINLALLCQTTEQAQVCHNLFKLGFNSNIISSLLTNLQLLPIINNLAMFETSKPTIINFLAFLKNQTNFHIKSFCQAVELLDLNKQSVAPFVDDFKKEQLFQLTSFIKKQKVALQSDLMKVAYVGLTTGSIDILQADLTQLEAKSSSYFVYQFLTTLKIMNSLEALQPDNNRELVKFLMQTNKEKALFINVINILEYECHKIRARLRQELPDKLDKIEQEEKIYRRKMYSIIFKQINSPNSEKHLLKAIKEAEQPFLAVANIDYHPWLRCTLAIITNIVALLLTGSLANICHYKRSGDFFFFQHTTSGEKIKALDINITEQLKPTLKT
ncbi:hypothetical protein [Legionella gresilensis]|uniref:hypothetical protein n=1 Tax=Legionella gresilensis TaxID=91823 RepID=UPI0010415392|nr:hypothetical protein [Legionella gresilensis]